MSGTSPAGQLVTSHTELRRVGGIIIIQNQKIAVLIIVRIMTGGALHLAGIIQGDFRRQGAGYSRVNQATGGGIGAGIIGQLGIVNKRNRMIRRKVGVKRQRGGVHGDAASTTADRAQGNRAIVTAQAKTRGTVRLADDDFQSLKGRAGEGLVRGGRQLVIPKRAVGGGGTMRGVAKNANLGFGVGMHRPGTADRKIMPGVDDAVGIVGASGHRQKKQAGHHSGKARAIRNHLRRAVHGWLK